MKGFKDFIMRGNVIDLAVAIVIGTAFAALVGSLVADILTPVIAAIIGKPDFSNLAFTINGSRFTYGNFINALITFISVAGAVYFFVIVPLEKAQSLRGGDPDLATRDCPECLSEIPAKARRCAHCTSPLAA